MAMIQSGRHEVTVASTSLMEKGESITIVVTFQDATGDTIKAFLATSDAAWPYTERKLQTLGWNPVENDFAFDQFDADPSPILGAACQIVVEDDEWQGQVRPKVKYINPPGGGSKMSRERARDFAQRFKARMGNGTREEVPF